MSSTQVNALPFLFVQILILVMSCVTNASTPQDNQDMFELWSKINRPYPGMPEPVGTYQAGCLLGAVPLPVDGPGYAVMRTSRRRYYAHPDLIRYVQELSEKLRGPSAPLLLMGDLSSARGGPMKFGHASHQIGLDADIWLTMGESRPTTSQRESWSATGFVSGRKVLRKNWGPTQERLISSAADSPMVNRIFVSPAIKRHFCHTQPSAPWLYKLRAWWGHEDHMHVRLNCPESSMSCVAQSELNPKDNGCGQDLAWWFSKEADDDWQKIRNDKSPREFPDIPSHCNAMVKETKPNSVTAKRSTSDAAF